MSTHESVDDIVERLLRLVIVEGQHAAEDGG